MSDGVARLPRAWLFGSVPDLLLGCGGLYLAGWFALTTLASGLLTNPPSTLQPLLILLFSVPHYGATLLRVYERRESRQTYAVFAVWVTVALVTAFGFALHSYVFACWMVTLYLTWSPWHYTGQNYGVAVMFLRRQGVAVEGMRRRLLHTSFALSYALTMLVIHAKAGRMTDYQVDAALAEGIRFIPIGIPGPLADAAILAIAAAWGTATIAAIGLLLPVATMRGLIPIFSILLVQSLWFTIPYALGHFQIETGLPVVDLGTRQGFFTYIAIAHAVQYLWITTYFARASVEWSGYGRYWLKAMLFGQTAAALPILLVTKSGVGNFSYDGGLLLLVVAFVNLHHFILDGAIWKLRASRIARVLVRADRDESQSNATSWPRRLAWTVAGAVFVVGVATHVDRHHVFPAALERQHTVAAQSALDRLALLGHDAGSDRLRLAILYADQSRSADAEREVQRSIELRPMPEGFGVLGKLKTRAGDWAAARSAFESGLALAPNDSRLLRGAGVAAYQLGDWSGAEVHLQSAVARRRKDPETTTLLRDARVRLRGGAGEDRPE